MIIAASTVRDLLDENNQKLSQLKDIWCKKDENRLLGDLNIMLSAVGYAESSKQSHLVAGKIGLRQAALAEVRKLRRLIVYAVNRIEDGSASLNKSIQPPNPTQVKLLIELFLSGFGDQIAQKISGTDEYKIPSIENPVKIHPHSGIYSRNKIESLKGSLWKLCRRVIFLF